MRTKKRTEEQQKIIDRCLAEQERLTSALNQVGYDLFSSMGELEVENLGIIAPAIAQAYMAQRQLATFKSSGARQLANVKGSVNDISVRAFIEGHMRARAHDEERRERAEFDG